MQDVSTHREPHPHVRPALTRRAMVATGVLSAISALVLAGCGGGTATTSSGAIGGVAPVPNSAAHFDSAPSAKAAPGTPGPAEVSRTGTAVVGIGPKLTRSASLEISVKNIGTAAASVHSIASGLQGLVLSEQIGNGGDPGPLKDGTEPFAGSGTLTLSVPADKLDIALDQLARIGTVLQRISSSQDVTSQYVDTQSRLKTMRASVERVRALMARAKDLGQVVALESEMSRREADLESLESQMDALKNSVERSTLTVSLSTPSSIEPATTNSFLAGLSSGWAAFTSSAGGLFTAVGASLPFALFFTLLGMPIWTWWRRHRA
jgi:hypothetical protein